MLTKECIINSVGQARELANNFLSVRLAAKGVTDILPSQGGIFGFLFKNNGVVQMKDIPGAVKRTKSTVNSLVNTLVKNGYLEKTACPKDKRVSFVALTGKGWNMQEIFAEISGELVQATIQDIETADMDTFLKVLNQIITNLTNPLED